MKAEEVLERGRSNRVQKPKGSSRKLGQFFWQNIAVRFLGLVYYLDTECMQVWSHRFASASPWRSTLDAAEPDAWDAALLKINDNYGSVYFVPAMRFCRFLLSQP